MSDNMNIGGVQSIANADKSGDQSVKDETDSYRSVISQRMTIAGVFFDIALFVSDVEHLKFTIDWGRDAIENYSLILGLLISSLSLQLIVGALLFSLSVKKTKNQSASEANTTGLLYHVIIGLVTVIALINICATIFGDRGDAITRFSAIVKDRYNCTDK